MNRIEKGEYSNIEHHFMWIDIKTLEQYNLLPIAIKDVIKNRRQNFHLINKN